MISGSRWCFHSLLVEKQRDGLATGAEYRPTCERDAHNAKRDGLSNEG